jgi:hypothetical protein
VGEYPAEEKRWIAFTRKYNTTGLVVWASQCKLVSA